MHIPSISDAPIIGSVIGIGHYRPLFLVSVSVIYENVTDIVKIVPIMSFQVIKASLIAFRILIKCSFSLKESESRG